LKVANSTSRIQPGKREAEERRQLQTRFFLVGAVAVLLLIFFIVIRSQGEGKPTDDPSYFTGNIYNHNGDLVSPDGKILKKAEAKPPKRG